MTAATRPIPPTPATTPGTAATTASPDPVRLTLEPVGLDEFLAGAFEREPLAISRAEAGRFDAILSADDVERLVCARGIRVPAFRLVADGAPLPPREYTEDIAWRPSSFDGLARVDRVAAAHAAGATIVLQALQLHWQPAAVYCRGLEQRLGFPVQANAYSTPAAARGFAVHHDTHDVFVLQVSGTKRWRIYAPVLELPTSSQRWSPALGDPGRPVDDVTLEPGDTLYLPRGWPHEAVTQEDDSLHITVGMHVPTRLDALRAALDECRDDVEFRRSVGPDGEIPRELLDRLADRLAPEAVAARARRRFVDSRRPVLDDGLTQVRAAASLGAGDVVERRDSVIAECDGTTLRFEGKEIRFPEVARDALAAVAEAERPFTAADLPGTLDEKGRLVLVRRLIREGFLRASQPA
jgi:bifunctional lysine-specific demethylase and histidyl-hydroxylase NO66